ncbi:hypothetical protein N7462_004005 [Penicillium macrosclerotiorum]|uniref:uncharacterized protein n=1 Tax=Penicillium macrosclerotiorum TaxID=303699 RepID=UPI0025481EC3|nr:uncharacterized protein N7462_004005 [Penicillium macrosclerotiorum]KAJ5689613.1 hypothetical protein N7462_004005 [Penicillium macrosclerotiorum]
MTRGALIGLIHARSLTAEKSPAQDGNALTLMSTDVDSVDTCAEMLHETWAQVVEVIVGTTLLAREIGWFALLPLLIVPANLLGIFSPVLTLVMFALSRKMQDHLDADMVFTSIALLALVTHPANMVMTIIPRAITSLANFERLQAYLTQGSLRDQRVSTFPPSLWSDYKRLPGQRPAIVLENVNVQLSSSSAPLLQDVNLLLDEGSICICSGPIGSGKSVLALTILGEMNVTKGRVAVRDGRIAFCSPLVWLPVASIRDVVCGQSTSIDLVWYQTVIQACNLNADLENLVDGDMALIGNGGINLSAGQKSRIALARAVYSRCHIMVLDDPFSALDGAVEDHIVNALLGPEGILRKLKSTIFLITHSTQHYPLADKVILLNEGRVQVLGPQDKFLQGNTQMTKIRVSRRAAEGAGFEESAKSLAYGTRIDDAAADTSRRTGDLAVYDYYFGSAGKLNILLMASCTAIYAFSLTFSQYILKWWAESTTKNSSSYMIFYIMFSLLAWIATNGTMCCPLSYFSTFEIGAILNRFGQDIQLVDKELPSAFANLSTQIFKLIMQAIVLVLTPDQVEGINTIRAFGWQGKFATNNIEKLEVAQSPLYLLLCLQRWLNVVLDFLIAGIAVSFVTSAMIFRETATGASIGIALNMIIAANTTLLRLVENWTTLETSLGSVARLRSVDQDTPSEKRDWDSLEPSQEWPNMGSIKIKHLSAGYSSQSPVLHDIDMDIPAGQHLVLCGRTGSGKSTFFLMLLQLLTFHGGTIEVDGVDISRLPVNIVRRRCFISVPQDPFILPNASLRFNLDPYNQHQDAYILKVLQRTGVWPDIQDTLSRTMNGLVLKTGNSNFLDLPMTAFPPMSTGQRQMLALAQTLLRAQPSTRGYDSAIIQRKPIVILDEASSSLDLETETKMQEILKEHFSSQGHTIISISHRLNSLQNDLRPGLDKVVWMVNGRLEELQGFSANTGIPGTTDASDDSE